MQKPFWFYPFGGVGPGPPRTRRLGLARASGISLPPSHRQDAGPLFNPDLADPKREKSMTPEREPKSFFDALSQIYVVRKLLSRELERPVKSILNFAWMHLATCSGWSTWPRLTCLPDSFQAFHSLPVRPTRFRRTSCGQRSHHANPIRVSAKYPANLLAASMTHCEMNLCGPFGPDRLRAQTRMYF